MTKGREIEELRKLGELDVLAGKPIEAFCDIPDIDRSDDARKEIGLRLPS